jgi:hypothetical protein
MVQDVKDVLKRTLARLEVEKARTEKQIKAIKSALGALGAASPHAAGRRERRRMSAAERRRVSRRMKAYWAKRRAQKGS